MNKTHWQIWTINLPRSWQTVLTNLSTQNPWMKWIQVWSNEGSCPNPKGLFMLSISMYLRVFNTSYMHEYYMAPHLSCQWLWFPGIWHRQLLKNILIFYISKWSTVWFTLQAIYTVSFSGIVSFPPVITQIISHAGLLLCFKIFWTSNPTLKVSTKKNKIN